MYLDEELFPIDGTPDVMGILAKSAVQAAIAYGNAYCALFGALFPMHPLILYSGGQRLAWADWR